jgi:predicted ArsR family transcriptional regulator
MTSADFAGRVSGVAALAEPVRRDLYLFVAAQPDAVSRDQAAQGVGVPRHTAKFHLDKLVDEGLLDIEFKRLSGRRGPGAGRPSKLYRRAAREVAVSLPERRYDLAGQLMAEAIETSGRAGTPVLQALHDAAAAFGASVGDEARTIADTGPVDDDGRDVTCRVLAAHGYEPRVDGHEITLRNCPFHALVQEHTELVCGMNLALVGAVTERLDDRLTPRLNPAEGRCCVVIGSP